ncbi:class I SAM-dependent methyltransferase [Rhizobium deserti]|uniref:Class I SAM-dependent methyltransferase n=1 Tax=Rhizobium deserti TaxID=2547961 RepID=A0A4R5UP92_9HYPH|nr:class I SAM-dependent methyltransferase [Rhizobium deserti]TDK39773.1 class I SAM-dependent methyltransferase [Rhizobium deserti]
MDDNVFEQYCFDSPSNQTAVDAVSGWTSAFPPEAEIWGGTHPLFADDRIIWAVAQMEQIQERRILEVGPLEGMHTYILNKHRPAIIDAIEANTQCFLRCLITKEILNIDRAKFHLGDALKWLDEKELRYDLIIASGVLYHMADPAQFIAKMAARCDNLYIWTHYFDDAAMPPGDSRRQPLTGNVETREVGGVPVRYYERGYFKANTNSNFCGGMRDRHYWMHRQDIISLLSGLGFGNLEVAHEDPKHPNGPSFSIFAKRVVQA